MSNSDIMACERARTGNYGEDFMEQRYCIKCPICEAEDPDTFYYDHYMNDVVVGCSNCLTPVKFYDAAEKFPHLIERRK